MSIFNLIFKFFLALLFLAAAVYWPTVSSDSLVGTNIPSNNPELSPPTAKEFQPRHQGVTRFSDLFGPEADSQIRAELPELAEDSDSPVVVDQPRTDFEELVNPDASTSPSFQIIGIYQLNSSTSFFIRQSETAEIQVVKPNQIFFQRYFLSYDEQMNLSLTDLENDSATIIDWSGSSNEL